MTLFKKTHKRFPYHILKETRQPPKKYTWAWAEFVSACGSFYGTEYAYSDGTRRTDCSFYEEADIPKVMICLNCIKATDNTTNKEQS